MRPATSPESAADPIARAVANRAGAVLDPHDRATLEHAARGGLADAIARAHAAVAAQRTAVRPPGGIAFDGQARSRRSRYFWLSFASEISRQVFPRTICVQEGPAIGSTTWAMASLSSPGTRRVGKALRLNAVIRFIPFRQWITLFTRRCQAQLLKGVATLVALLLILAHGVVLLATSAALMPSNASP
jgi:hypothetical protein